jgi:hypothetical protein
LSEDSSDNEQEGLALDSNIDIVERSSFFSKDITRNCSLMYDIDNFVFAYCNDKDRESFSSMIEEYSTIGHARVLRESHLKREREELVFKKKMKISQNTMSLMGGKLDELDEKELMEYNQELADEIDNLKTTKSPMWPSSLSNYKNEPFVGACNLVGRFAPEVSDEIFLKLEVLLCNISFISDMRDNDNDHNSKLSKDDNENGFPGLIAFLTKVTNSSFSFRTYVKDYVKIPNESINLRNPFSVLYSVLATVKQNVEQECAKAIDKDKAAAFASIQSMFPNLSLIPVINESLEPYEWIVSSKGKHPLWFRWLDDEIWDRDEIAAGERERFFDSFPPVNTEVVQFIEKFAPVRAGGEKIFIKY